MRETKRYKQQEIKQESHNKRDSPKSSDWLAALWHRSEIELQSYYYADFRTNTVGKGMNPLIPQAMGQIVPPLFFYVDYFGNE